MVASCRMSGDDRCWGLTHLSNVTLHVHKSSFSSQFGALYAASAVGCLCQPCKRCIIIADGSRLGGLILKLVGKYIAFDMFGQSRKRSIIIIVQPISLQGFISQRSQHLAFDIQRINYFLLPPVMRGVYLIELAPTEKLIPISTICAE